jgi:hypothetical protein
MSCGHRLAIGVLACCALLSWACASQRSGPDGPGSKCARASGPTEEPGVVWCSASCEPPRVAAVCNGPAGRPVACACTAGRKQGHTFALDRCESLDGVRAVERCGGG